jgi:DNA polymerase I-like protein with 3'-5' exonuclease and polymerase domains
MVAHDIDTDEVHTFVGDIEIKKGLQLLSKADDLVGHNIVDYDLPVLKKLFNWEPKQEVTLWDTLIMAKLAFQDIRNHDFRQKPVGLEPAMYGSHKLKAWGQRLGEHKGDFDGGDWQTYSPEMLEYCIQDNKTTVVLFKYLKGMDLSVRSLELETQIQQTAVRMEINGFTFDEKAGASLYADLAEQREVIRKSLVTVFPTRTVKRTSEKTGKPLKDQVIEFNPSSRDHIAYWFKKNYDWKPKEFTPSGKAEINEEILNALDYPEAKQLAQYFMLEKRIGMLGEGNGAWLRLIRNGRIHGRMNVNGAATGRATHSNPNMAQIPSVRKPYGKEIRSLFTVPKGYKLVGTDLSGIELRCLAHYLAAYDNGEYANEIMHGDVHTRTMEAAGLPTRDKAKTFTYALLYGAGDAKMGAIVGGGLKEGKAMKAKFFTSLPAFGTLSDKVKKAAERGFILALDGRRLPVRSGHGAINSLLQGAAAVIAKKWVVTYEKMCEEQGWINGKDFWFSAFVHDEVQVTCREDLAEKCAEISVAAALKAGEELGVRIPVGAEAKVGNNWYDCH